MGRLRRTDVPGAPLHIVQRGNNRAPCFVVPGDYPRYLAFLLDAAERTRSAVHAYALMTNHVHLLVSPGEPGAASALMHLLGTRYVAYFNRRHDRSGTLWEGRFRSCVVDSEAYLLRCYQYIELNPVRAGMVVRPEDYRWSSYRRNALGVHDNVVSDHPAYTALDSDPSRRCMAYRFIVAGVQPEHELAEIRAGIARGQAARDAKSGLQAVV